MTCERSEAEAHRRLRHDQSSAGLNCGPNGGAGGGGENSRVSTGGFGFGRTRFSSHKGVGFACRLESEAVEGFSETRLMTGLRLDLEQALRDSGAQINDSGNPSPSTFYFGYTLKSVQGRVQISGQRIRANYYDIRADLDENGK